jgi:SAM-dependent methyltransferase
MSLAGALQPAPERSCPLCGLKDAERLHTQPFVLPEGHPLAGGYDVVCCRECGLVYADSSVPQQSYDDYYARLSKYEDARTATGGGDQPWDDERLAVLADTIARQLPGREVKIADIGCANGGLLRHLSRLGFRRLYGVDPSPGCARAANSIPGATGLMGSLFALPAGIGGADCVVLSHVLEHLQHVRPGLAAARGLLRQGGIVYVEVPDATRYADCLAAPFQDFNTEHLNHFGPESLRALLIREGFEVRSIERKTIAAGVGIPYPAVYGIGRVGVGAEPSQLPPTDWRLRASIIEYVRQSAVLLDVIDAQLGPLLDDLGPILVWGVGQLTFKLLAMTRLARAPIVGFIDSNPMYHRMRLRGRPIFAPESILEQREPVLVATLLHGDSIEAQIRQMGAPNRVLRLTTTRSR